MPMKFRVLIAAILIASNLSFAAEKNDDTHAIRDAKDYILTIEKASKLKLDDQIDAWQTFLSDHPKHTFRKEIEKNIEVLQSLSQKGPTAKQGDERDAELYLKALDFSKKLSLNDQIDLWKQFLDENPTSIYRTEAQNRLIRLQRYKAKKFPQSRSVPAQPMQPTSPKPSSQAPVKAEPVKITVGSGKKLKDEDQALLLASLAGIVVPGMGHWYTEDYVIAGTLTALRLLGLGIGIPGVVNSNYTQIYVGGGIALVSYVIDVADAPYSAQRFNNKQQSAYLLPEDRNTSTIPLLAYNFKF